MIEEPKLKSTFTEKDAVGDSEEEIRANDKVFDEIKRLKNIFPERDDTPKEELSVEDILRNGHTHTLISNTEGFADVDFRDTIRKRPEKEEKKEVVTEEEKRYISNAENVLENIFKEIDEEEKKYTTTVVNSDIYDDISMKANIADGYEKEDEDKITFVNASVGESSDYNDLRKQNIETFDDFDFENRYDDTYKDDLFSNYNEDDDIIKEYMKSLNMNSEQPFTVSTRGSSPVIDVSDGNDVSDLHNMLEMEDEAELDLDIFGEGR